MVKPSRSTTKDEVDVSDNQAVPINLTLRGARSELLWTKESVLLQLLQGKGCREQRILMPK